MYVGYCDGQVLFANSRPEEYAITDGAIDVRENAAAQFNFTLPPTNIARGLIVPAASIIKVEQDGNEVFRGVLTQYTVDNYGNYVCVAMDLLTCLDNVLKAPFTSSGIAVNSYVSTLLSNYNSAVAGDKKITLGNITVSGSITIKHDAEYKSIFALFKELISQKDGLLRLRYESSKVYLDYLKSDSNISAQTITFGKNIIDISSQIDTSTLVSRVYPIGSQGLTIASVNSGKNYLVNTAVEATYGRIDKTINVNSDNAATVKSYGQAYLTRYAALKNTITLTAIDLSILDKTLSSFEIGQKVRVISPPHGIDANMPITSIIYDVVRPSRSTVTLGSTHRTMTGAVLSADTSPECRDIAIDYIVDQGVSNNWNYRKWNSGHAECWRSMKINNNACNTAVGSWFRTAELESYAYPFAFVETPNVNMFFETASGTGGLVWSAGTDADDDDKTRPHKFYIIRMLASDAISGRVHFSVKGRWK